jgi:hypothetical protein
MDTRITKANYKGATRYFDHGANADDINPDSDAAFIASVDLSKLCKNCRKPGHDMRQCPHTVVCLCSSASQLSARIGGSNVRDGLGVTEVSAGRDVPGLNMTWRYTSVTIEDVTIRHGQELTFPVRVVRCTRRARAPRLSVLHDVFQLRKARASAGGMFKLPPLPVLSFLNFLSDPTIVAWIARLDTTRRLERYYRPIAAVSHQS